MIAGRLYRIGGAAPLLDDVMRTSNALERARGLLGRSPLGEGQGFLIAPCAAVHTMGMRYVLDVAYLDRNWEIRKVIQYLKPWRLSACAGAAMTLELAAGRSLSLGLVVGERLAWQAH